MIYDTIIIGAGPAAFTAALYAKRREMETLVIGENLGGQLALASEIENYPGFKSISSHDLINKIYEQIINIGVKVKFNLVKKIENINNTFTVSTGKETFQAKTIIIAIGLTPKRLSIKGEEEFTGKGVSYCVNCDGPFYKNKTVAVIGGGNSALDGAEVLSKIAKKVYLIHRREEFRAFDSLITQVKAKENIDILTNTQITEIIGDNIVKKIKIKNTKEKKEEIMDMNGVFMEIGSTANTDLVANFVKKDDANQIIVDSRCRTETPGVFAAGDVLADTYKQLTVACGHATTAALSAYQYIRSNKL